MSDSVETTRPELPPLRIHHLMACAVVAAIQLSLWRTAFQGASQILSLSRAVTAIYYGLSAIGLTLAILSIYWHFKGYASLVQPGQWLLIGYVIHAIDFCATLITIALARNTELANDTGFWEPRVRAGVRYYLAQGAIYYVLPFVIFGWCAWRIADSTPWRIVFAISAIAPIVSIPSIYGWFIHTQRQLMMALVLPLMFRSTVLLLFKIWATVDDSARQRKRFWTHWVGLFLSMIGDVLSIVGGMVYWFALH